LKSLVIASDCLLPRKDGISIVLDKIIPELAKKYRITVLAPNFGAFKGYGKVHVVRFPLVRFLKAGDYVFCRPNYRQVQDAVRNADVVMTHTLGPVGAMAIAAAKLSKKPLIAYVHSIEWELAANAILLGKFTRGKFISLAKGVIKRMYNLCNLVLVPSAEVSKLLKKVGVTARKKIVRLGIDTKRFVPPRSKEAAKKAIKINPNEKVVGFCGRIGREKDLMTLYNAFQLLRRKRQDVTLLIVGSGLNSMEEFFRKQQGIIMAGAVDNVVPYLQAMDVYVLPSLTETTSLSTLEAMSCGLAIASTPVGCVKEYMKENYNGRFFPTGDSIALCKVLEAFLSNEQLRKRLGRNARATIVKSFQKKRFVSQMKKVIDSF
jgi:glycosyltransferase involved in cell wall biosynthesis